MEALYEKAIAKLHERVGCLETKSSTSSSLSASSATLKGSQRKIVITPPPSNNQAPERANIGGPQKSSARAVPKIGRLVPGSKAGSLPNGLQ